MTKELLPELGSGALREALHAIGLRLEGKAFPMTPHDMAEPCITLADYQTEVQGLLAALSLSSPIEPDRSIEWNIRSWLWDTHGHTMLYGDDGEMQCKECPLDYKRAPLIECFERANTELGLVRVKASRAQASSEIREKK